MARRGIYTVDASFGVDPALSRSYGAWVNNTSRNPCLTAGRTINLGRSGKGGLRYNSMIRFSTPTLPKNSRILSTKLRMTANNINNGTNHTVDLAVLAPDNHWERNNQIPLQLISTNNPSKFTRKSYATDTVTKYLANRVRLYEGATLLADTVPSPPVTFSHYFLNSKTGTVLQQAQNKNFTAGVGQVITVDTSGTLDTIDFFTARSGSNTGGEVSCRLWNVNGNFEPTDLILETNSVSADSIGGAEAFNSFTLSSSFSVTAGESYLVELTTTKPYSADSNIYARVVMGSSGIQANAWFYRVLTTGGFGYNNYFSEATMPILYTQNTGTTINAQPWGSITTGIPFPAQQAGDIVELSGFETPIQEWVDSPKYEELGRIIGLTLNTGDGMPINSERNYVFPLELEIDFDPSTEVNIT